MSMEADSAKATHQQVDGGLSNCCLLLRELGYLLLFG
jgi:hypothetical protein